MQDLLDAIKAKAATVVAAQFDGGWWEDELPPEADLRATYYAVIHTISAQTAPRSTSSGTPINPYTARFQIDAWGPAKGSVLSKLKLLANALDEQLVSVAGGKINYDMRRLDEPHIVPSFVELGSDKTLGAQLKHAIVEFEYDMYPG